MYTLGAQHLYTMLTLQGLYTLGAHLLYTLLTVQGLVDPGCPPPGRVREPVERVRPGREGKDQAHGRRHPPQED